LSSKTPKRTRGSAKVDHLLDVATELFNRNGERASGIDQLIAKAGIAKTTLYRHFPSKDDLIVAVLKRLDHRYRKDMRDFIDRNASDPKEKLLLSFEYLEQWFASDDFHGCPFMSARSEYNDPDDPVFREARLHKRLMIAYFEELAHEEGLANARKVAEEIHLLHEGATAIAHTMGDPSVAREAGKTARRLLATAGKDE